MNNENKKLIYFILVLLALLGLYQIYVWLPDRRILADAKSIETWRPYTNSDFGIHLLLPPHWTRFYQPREARKDFNGTPYVEEAYVATGPPPSPNSVRNTGGIVIYPVHGQHNAEGYTDHTTTTATPLAIGGYPGTFTVYRATSDGKIRVAMYRFTSPPPRWAAEGNIAIFPLYDGSIGVEKKILETMTFTTAQ